MIFSSLFFLFTFLPLTLIVYYLVPQRAKNPVLLAVSLLFYAWGEPVYVLLMLFSMVFNYFSGLQLGRLREGKEHRALTACLVTTVAVNLCVLGFFKYYGFVIANLNQLFHVSIPIRELALPIGISFYTFQTLSYIIDVYRGKVPVQRSFVTFGTYVSMFPQLIAGPIVRYADIAGQLRHRTVNLYKFGEGLTWFLRGLAKKAILANQIGLCHDAILALGAGERSVLTAWIGALAYTMQIYFDFGGYSDMAIGLGKMLGFEFPENFRYPYRSGSITEFWRRWHISLGSWFREYVYIPLGGNRVTITRHILNIMVVWLLTGFWHGAAWNFVLWGVFYGGMLILEKYVLGRFLDVWPTVARRIYTFVVVLLAWVLFFSSSLGDAVSYYGTMFGVGGAGLADAAGWYFLRSYGLLLVVCILCCGPWLWKLFSRVTLRNGMAPRVISGVVYGGMFVLSVACLVNATYNPFLYFRF